MFKKIKTNNAVSIPTRVLARYIDIFIVGGIIFIIAESFNFIKNTDPAGDIKNSIIILPIYIILDAIICTAFGNNLGKILLGIKIISTDPTRKNITFYRYLKRNLSMYVKGLVFGLPIIPMFALIYQVNMYEKRNITSWDQNNSTNIIPNGANPTRTFFCGCLFLFLFFACIMNIPNQPTEAETSALTYDSKQQQNDTPSKNINIMNNITSEVNKQLPIKINDMVTFTSVSYNEDNNTYNEFYNLYNKNGTAFNITNPTRIQNAFAFGIKKAYCGPNEEGEIRKMNINIHVQIIGKDNNHVDLYQKPEDCN